MLNLTISISLVLCLLQITSNIAGEIRNGTDKQCSQRGRQYRETLCEYCVCGHNSKMTRIVGGWSTQVDEYPWMVALAYRKKIFCGGTLINDLYVLTAAHCLRDLTTADITVIISKHNTALDEVLASWLRKPVKLIKHPHFGDQVKFNNDIALIKLDSRVMLSSSVRPACLPPRGDSFTQQEAKVIGWGAVKEGGSATTELMATSVKVLDNNDCKILPGFPSQGLTSNMMCAGQQGGGRDSCQGDSGGPLLITDLQGRFVAAGIVSWGVGCGRPNRPGVYTRVNNYLDWIIDKTRDACYCF